MSRIVITLGGNALGDTPAEQRAAIDKAARPLIGLIAQGHEILVSHGNGPQVGAISLAFAKGHQAQGCIPEMDLPECTAMSQGYIGYQLQQGLLRELRTQGMPWEVATVITQVEVDPNDTAFSNPTKPIGGFYSENEAKSMMAATPGLVMRQDSGRGWRRVVPSPRPSAIVERDSILNLLDHEFVVIACGGGGVPVIRRSDGDYEGVSAVIDKDFTSAALADAVNANCLFILTAVDKVSLNFGQPNQVDVDEMSTDLAEQYAKQGQFGTGSMLPKVLAAVDYVRRGTGRQAVIGSLERAPEAMAGKSGTLIHK